MAFVRATIGASSQRWPFEDAQSENNVSLLYTVPPHQPRRWTNMHSNTCLGAALLLLHGDTLHKVFPLMRAMSIIRGPRISATHASARSGIWRKISGTALRTRETRVSRLRSRSCNIKTLWLYSPPPMEAASCARRYRAVASRLTAWPQLQISGSSFAGTRQMRHRGMVKVRAILD